MDEKTGDSRMPDGSALTAGEIGKLVLQLPVRLLRLPFDLLFLTVDFLRLSLWALRNLSAFFQSVPPRPYSPLFSRGVLEEGGDESKWYCPFASKYGSKSLLRLLFSRLQWYRSEDGRRYLSWVGRRRDAPTSLRRYLTGALFLGFFWVGVLAVVSWVTLGRSPYTVRSSTIDRSSPDTATLTAIQDPALAERHVDMAAEAMQKGNMQEARELYRKASRMDSSNVDAFVGLGEACLALTFLNDAANAFERALQLQAGHLEARLGMARVHRRKGANQRAMAILEELQGTLAADPRVRVLKAQCLLDLGNTEEARNALDEAVADHPRDLEVLEVAAEIALRERNLNVAEQRFRAMVDIDSDHVPARIGIGRVLRLKGRLKESEGVFAMLHSEYPGDPRVVSQLVDTLVASGKAGQAIALCRETVKAQPDLLELRARLGGLALALGRHNEVYNVAQELLRLDPGNVAAHTQLAAMYLQKELTTLAVEHANKAAAQSPGAEHVYRLRVSALMADGALAQAEERLRALLRVRPDDLQSLLSLSDCQHRQQRPREALETLQTALESHAQSMAVHSALGQLLFQMDRQREAETHFRKALEFEPDDVKALNNVAAVINYNGGDLDEALGYALKAHGIDPLNAQVADTLAWIYAARKEYEKALPLTAMAVAARPELPNLQYHRGAVLAATGQVEEGAQWLRRALGSGIAFQGRDEARHLLETLEGASGRTAP